ncbi:tektin bundle-interacting protein 1 [Pelodytes ibericus]
MENSQTDQHVPRRTLETEFPATHSSIDFMFLHGRSSCPTLRQAVRCSNGPMGADVKSHMFYTGKNRETFQKWRQEYKQREREDLPHASSQYLRETAWYDPSLPAQYLQDSARWGAFCWRERPVLGKEFVLNRHHFVQEVGIRSQKKNGEMRQ